MIQRSPNHVATASIKKPIHNVKERRQIRQIRHLAVTKIVVFISGKSVIVSNPAGREEIEMVELSGFEPLTPCLQSRCSTS
jgi:hypothetical protein